MTESRVFHLPLQDAEESVAESLAYQVLSRRTAVVLETLRQATARHVPKKKQRKQLGRRFTRWKKKDQKLVRVAQRAERKAGQR